jgi:hypothetical protein
MWECSGWVPAQHLRGSEWDGVMQEGGPGCSMVIKQLPAIPVILDIRISSKSGRGVPCPRASGRQRRGWRGDLRWLVSCAQPHLLLPSFFIKRAAATIVSAHRDYWAKMTPFALFSNLDSIDCAAFTRCSMELTSKIRGRTQSPCMCMAHEPQRHSRWPDPATPRSRTANYSSTKAIVITQPGYLRRLINWRSQLEKSATTPGRTERDVV